MPGLPHEPRAGPRALLNPRGQLQSEGEWMAGPASQRRRAAMDKRSFCSAMHKSMDSPLTGRLPTFCPQTYAQRCSYAAMRIAYPQPFLLLLLSNRSCSAKDALCLWPISRCPGKLRASFLTAKQTDEKVCLKMMRKAQNPECQYAYQIPNEAGHYGILIIIGTTIWLTPQEPGSHVLQSCTAGNLRTV